MTSPAELLRERASEKSHATRAQEGVHPASRVEEEEWMQGRIEPEPQPGMVQRWVRIDLMNTADNTNVTKMFAEGWRPRPAESVPDVGNMGYLIGAKGKPHAGCIIDRDRILCEMPAERAAARERFMKARTDRMNDAVNKDIHKHIPNSVLSLNGRRSQVAIGTGKPRVPPVAGDDE